MFTIQQGREWFPGHCGSCLFYEPDLKNDRFGWCGRMSNRPEGGTALSVGAESHTCEDHSDIPRIDRSHDDSGRGYA